MEADCEKNKWTRYRTIDRFTYRNRMRMATALLIAGYLIFFASAIIVHVASEKGKWTDMFSPDGIPLAPYVSIGLALILGLCGLHWVLGSRITKNQCCPKCKRLCEDKESAGNGEVYLVCHECMLKWDTGINNSNWE